MTETTRDHILEPPKWVFYLRFAQVGVALLILALSAFGLSVAVFDGDSLMLYAAISCMIVAVYNIVAVMAQPIIYNYWAILGLDIYQIVIWLTAMALLASEISGTGSIGGAFSVGDFTSGISTGDGDNCYYGYCFRKRSLERRYISVKTAKAARDALAATCGLAGLELILFTITLIFISLALHRHRKEGGHCIPSSGGLAGPRTVSNEPKDPEAQVQQPQPNAQYQEPQYAPAAVPQPQGAAQPVPAAQQTPYPA